MINSFQLHNLNRCCIYSKTPVDGKMIHLIFQLTAPGLTEVWKCKHTFFFFPLSFPKATKNDPIFLSEFAKLIRHPTSPGPRTLNLMATALGTSPALPLCYIHYCWSLGFLLRSLKQEISRHIANGFLLCKNCKVYVPTAINVSTLFQK